MRMGGPLGVCRTSPVHPHGDERQVVHRLVHAQALDVGIPDGTEGTRHLVGVEEGLEAEVLGTRGGSVVLDQVVEREPYPWNHHRPALDAAQAIDTLLQLVAVPGNQVLEIDHPRVVHLTADGDLPRTDAEPLFSTRPAARGDAYLVKVVLVDGLVQGVGRFVGIVDAAGKTGIRSALGKRLAHESRHDGSQPDAGGCRARPAHEFAPVDKVLAVGDLPPLDVRFVVLAFTRCHVSPHCAAGAAITWQLTQPESPSA